MKRVPWSEELAGYMRETFGRDEAHIKAMVESGHAAAFEFDPGQYVIVRFHETRAKKELVLMCAKGRGLSKHKSKLFECAKHWKCSSVRIHAGTEAIARLWLRVWPELSITQYVLTSEV